MQKKRYPEKCFTVAAFLLLISTSLLGLDYFNYAEALQKSLYFYDAEKSGPGITGGLLDWRGDSEIDDTRIPVVSVDRKGNGLVLSQEFIDANINIFDPEGDGTVDLSKGFHDAGDHVKFGLPQHYTLSTLGWSLHEFKDSFVEIGEYEHMLDLLKWGTDYLLKSVFRNESGEVIAYCFQVGNGDIDHSYWGPPELQKASDFPRPALFAAPESPGSDQAAGGAAALATMYFNYKEIDPAYAQDCLDNAMALYDFAVKYRGLGDSGGYYGSAYDHDELSWAAVWLYEATGNMDYIDDITSVDDNHLYTGYMSRIINSQTNTWQNIWVHCWDVVWGGTFVKLASLFPENELFDYFAAWNIEYWSGGSVPHADPQDGTYMKLTPQGYAMINTWGSARYNTAAQLCALIYHKHKNRPDFVSWAQGQMEYLMGKNKNNLSYIVGYGEKHVQHPHHRAAHGSKTNSMNVPEEHRHTLWGALVGGPDGDDYHLDATTDYVYNEVAIDYNAGFVGALAGLYKFIGKAQGHKPLADFPPPEPEIDAYYTEAVIGQESNERTQVTIKMHNESIHPPAYEYGLKCRYYFDITELISAGQSIDNVSLEIMYDENKYSYDGPVEARGPLVWDNENNIYYVEFDWSGLSVYGDRDYQFALVAQYGDDYKFHWDPDNDFSRTGIGDEDYSLAKNIPVYMDGQLVFGSEPEIGGATPGNGTPYLTPEPKADLSVLYRSENLDNHSSVINPSIMIKNTGGKGASLEDIRVRYYYTGESSSDQIFTMDFAAMGKNNVINRFEEGYIELSFTAEAGMVSAAGQSGEIQFRISNADWSDYDQSNDPSFKASASAYISNDKITLYLNDFQVWGTDPSGVTPGGEEPTPTVNPQNKRGDVNGDDSVNIIDALLTAQVYVGIEVAGFLAEAADVNCDLSINIIDAMLIAQFYVGILTDLTC
ncbi:MAG: glycoside hydrolase family 9 protein [Spirochaetales bacterium]|nr:glycoside hydrolase family 9 protein [Spirochaetales bacterium]